MVGVAAVRVRRRRPVVAVVAGAVEQVAGILVDVAAPSKPQELLRDNHRKLHRKEAAFYLHKS